MLKAVVDWSIHHRWVVVILSALLLGFGFRAVQRARLDVFPEFVPPQVVVQTEAPGLSAGEVEPLVTIPIEDAVNGLPGLATLRSQSLQGLSICTLVFEDGVDLYRARQLVAERLSEAAGRLPSEVRAPRMGPLTSSTGRLIVAGLTSERLSPLALRDFAQWTLRPRLLAVPGVAQVTIFGGGVREIQVRVRPETLLAHGLSLTDVVDAARQATGVRGAGFLETGEQRTTMRIEAQARTAAELGAAVVTSARGYPVRLRDVAEVVEAAEPKVGDAAIDGEAGVTINIFKQYGGDTLETTRKVEAELERLRPAFEHQGIVYHPALFRQADFIERAVGSVAEALLLGAGLVAAVLFLFLFNIRTAIISLTAIPLSLLGAILVLVLGGASLNTLTLGGLAIAVGEVVDDAVIDVENIHRRLQENNRLGRPRSALEVVLSASLEVRGAVVYATFIVVLVFVPIFFLGGLQGRLFAPLGYAYALAVLVSLAVALVVTPALSLLLLPNDRHTHTPWLLRKLQNAYEWLLRRIDRELPLVSVACVILLAAAGWAIWQFGGESLPEMRESHFVLHMQGAPGTSLERSLAVGKVVASELRKNPAVLHVSQQAGRAELAEDPWGVEYSEIEVSIKDLDAEEFEAAEESIKATLRDRFPGFSFEIFSFLSERIMETISGTIAPVAVKVEGDDLAALDRAAEQVAAVLGGVPGSDNVRPEAQLGQPELVIRVRPEDAARHNLRSSEILDAVHAAYQGIEVAQAYDRNRVVNLVVVLDPRLRQDPAAVADLPISAVRPAMGGEPWGQAAGSGPQSSASPAFDRIPLKSVADVFLSDGRFMIRHEGGVRQRLVTCNVLGRDVESFVTEGERKVRALALPPGIICTFTGAHEVKQATERELLWYGSGAAVGILVLLGMAFGSPRRTALILVNLPFALVGGVAVVYMMGGVLDVGSLVGFVTLFGITTRNSIMMVSHWQHLRERDGLPWGLELVIQGARERLAPVLMTAIVTALGLLPIALAWGKPGSEIEGPMALVILGGLVTSTALNLLVLPVLYRRLGEGRPQKATPSPA